MMKKSCLIVSFLLVCVVTQAEVVYTQEFLNPGADAAFTLVDWTCLATGGGAYGGTVIEYTFVATDPTPANRGTIAGIASGDYGFYAPSRQTKPDNDGREYSLTGPALIYTSEADDVLLSGMEELSFDERMDGSATDPAYVRFAIKIGGQWYVSDYQYSENVQDGTWENVSLSLEDWTDGANWRELTVVVSADENPGSAGELTVAGTTIGGVLNGWITDFGVFIETGNAGDHSRIDNFTVSASPIARGAAHTPTPADGELVDSTLLSEVTWQAPDVAADPNLLAVTSYDINYYIKDIDQVAADDPNFNPSNSFTTVTGVTSPYAFSVGFDKAVFWRVDAHVVWDSNDLTGTASFSSVVPGDTWMFTTLPSAPFILQQPASTRVSQSDSDAVFTCQFTSISVPMVEWYQVGNAIPLSSGGDIVLSTIDEGDNTYTTTLQILTPEPADDGEYYCTINNGTLATSDNAYLIVNQLLAEYKFEGNLAPAAGSLADAPTGQAKTLDGATEPNELLAAATTLTYASSVDGSLAVVLDVNDFVDFTADGYPRAGVIAGGLGRGMDAGTIIYWVKPNIPGNVYANYNDGTVAGFGASLTGSDPTEARIYVRGSNTAETAGIGLTSNTNQGSPDRPGWDLFDGEWHMIAATWSAGQDGSVYVDGQLVDIDSASTPDHYVPWQYSVLMGATRTSANRLILTSLFSGAIDNLRIYNYPLDADGNDVFAQEYYDNTGIIPCLNSNFAGNAFNFDNTGSSYCTVNLADFAVFAEAWLANGLWDIP